MRVYDFANATLPMMMIMMMMLVVVVVVMMMMMMMMMAHGRWVAPLVIRWLYKATYILSFGRPASAAAEVQ
jgi:hypothetical protein